MRKLLTTLFLCLCLGAYSQVTLNSLSFDGIDDEVVVPGASSLISGAGGLSMAFWVYPKNSPSGFPDFDGMAGFRNNIDADFYVLQLSANSIEARFRPSSGLATDITFSGLQINQWQHIAFTYNGSELKFYHNGTLSSSIPASGVIANSGTDLVLGNLYYQGTAFNYEGHLDEFMLLDRELSATEISCIAVGNTDTSMAGLKLFYNMNQGLPGGINTGTDSLIGLNSQIPGTLNNFALSDTVSNWVDGIVNVNFVQGDACTGSFYTFMGNNYSVGEHWVSMTDAQNCVENYYLTVNEITFNIDTLISLSGNTLTAAPGAGSYQWVNCSNNYAVIPGATNQIFTAGSSGTYACILGSSGCFDTTQCVTVNSSSITETGLGSFMVYPNPAKEFCTIEFSSSARGMMQIFDFSGRCLRQENVQTRRETLDLSDLDAGIYLIIFIDSSGNRNQRELIVSSRD